MPAFQPYRGKPAVRNDREGRGNVGIMRSPVRASTLPDCGGRAMKRTSLPLRAPAASWCDPAGESPAQVRSSVRLVASVAWPLATVVAKRTQRLHALFWNFRNGASLANRVFVTADLLFWKSRRATGEQNGRCLRGTVNGTVAVAVAEGATIGIV